MSEDKKEVKKENCFVTRVINALKGGDEKKLGKFQKGVQKWAKDQVKEIEARMEKNTDRLEEKQEGLDEYLLAVDLGKIATTDGRDEYILEYVQGYDKMVSEIDKLEETIEADQLLIEKRNALAAKMK